MKFTGEVIEWRGPAPFLFVRMPQAESDELRDRPELSYGWGCISVRARIGKTAFTTSLMPREGRYLVPVKVVVQRAEGVDLGDIVDVEFDIDERH